MRLPGRIAAAIEVLAEIEARRRPVSEALKSWALDHRFAGAGDRAAIGNLVYDALRRRASHAFRMGTDAPRALVLAVAVRDWGEPVEALDASFAEVRFAPESISEDEAARLCDDSALADAPDPVRANIPAWLAPAFARGLGPDWVRDGEALAARPPLDLRVNRLKSEREKVLKALARFDPVPGAIAPDAIRIAPGTRDARTPNVAAEPGYLKGWFEVQDEASQIAAALVGAQPGEQVLDFCAGAGGKTLALAAAMGNRGQIFAHDSDRTRLAPIHERLKRAGARNVQVRQPGATTDLFARMDRVLVDAPCTGSGTWRRRPETKWKLTPELLERRRAEQAAILSEAAAHVKPGGVLAYVTCSILPEENRDAIAALRAAHPDFEPLSGETLWAERFTAPFAGIADEGGGLTLTPARTGTDGFYFCALRRRT